MTFLVEVAGSASPSFQWQRNEVNIVGATASTYTIASAQLSDAANYRVVVTAGGSSENSLSATLGVGDVVAGVSPLAHG